MVVVVILSDERSEESKSPFPSLGSAYRP